MKRRAFLKMAAAGALASIGGVSFGSRKTTRPNFVFIIADDCTFRDIGCYGGQAHTPNIDKLAQESIVFENNFTSHTVTLPSFMSIITSLYPASHGVLYIAKDKLTPRIKTLAQILKLYGYKGTWLGPSGDSHLDPKIGFGRGFDTVGIFPDNLITGRKILFDNLEKNKTKKFFLNFHTYKVHAPYMPSKKYKEKFTKQKMREIIESSAELDKVTINAFKDAIYRKNGKVWRDLGKKLASELRSENVFDEDYIISKNNIISFLKKKNKDYIWPRTLLDNYEYRIDPHNKEIMNHCIALYDGEILEFDTEIIGPLIGKLKKLKLYDRTIIIICSDHGEEFGERSR